MSTLTNSLNLVKPTVGDPASQNAWGYQLDSDLDMIDTAVAGVKTIAVSGQFIVLTFTPGSPDQTIAGVYVLTGTLTRNCTILWPNGYSRKFAVDNQTTGKYTVTLGVNDGSGMGTAGTAVIILQAVVGTFYSDGTNVKSATTATGQRNGTLSKAVGGNTNITLTQQEGSNGNYVLTGVLTGNILLLFPQSYSGLNTIFNATTGNYNITLGIDNGSGSAAGNTVVIVPGGVNNYTFDGTNAGLGVNPQGTGLVYNSTSVAVANPSVDITLTHQQATFASVAFTGTLSTSISVLWPVGFVGLVAVSNQSTQPYNVTIGIDNGSGGAAGGTAILNRGGVNMIVFDGLNASLAVNASGMYLGAYIVRAIAVARCPGGALTNDFLGGCTLARTGAGVYTLTVTSGENFSANGASVSGNAYDSVTGKPLIVACTANAGGTNPSFTVNTVTGGGTLTDFTSGLFMVLGGALGP